MLHRKKTGQIEGEIWIDHRQRGTRRRRPRQRSCRDSYSKRDSAGERVMGMWRESRGGGWDGSLSGGVKGRVEGGRGEGARKWEAEECEDLDGDMMPPRSRRGRGRPRHNPAVLWRGQMATGQRRRCGRTPCSHCDMTHAVCDALQSARPRARVATATLCNANCCVYTRRRRVARLGSGTKGEWVRGGAEEEWGVGSDGESGGEEGRMGAVNSVKWRGERGRGEGGGEGGRGIWDGERVEDHDLRVGSEMMQPRSRRGRGSSRHKPAARQRGHFRLGHWPALEMWAHERLSLAPTHALPQHSCRAPRRSTIRKASRARRRSDTVWRTQLHIQTACCLGLLYCEKSSSFTVNLVSSFIFKFSSLLTPRRRGQTPEKSESKLVTCLSLTQSKKE